MRGIERVFISKIPAQVFLKRIFTARAVKERVNAPLKQIFVVPAVKSGKMYKQESMCGEWGIDMLPTMRIEGSLRMEVSCFLL